MYKLLFRLFLRWIDPELAHHLGAALIRFLGAVLPNPKGSAQVKVAGLSFENHLGIAAGFDKNAKMVRGLYKLGFGHVEVGTVTPKPQPGNPKPRLFRLIRENALINRMGFNNDGSVVIARRLQRLRQSGAKLPIIGVNIGKNKLTEPALAADDYAKCARELAEVADYLAVNVSSPNTPGLRDLQQVSTLRPILVSVIENAKSKPVFVKIAPDLADEDALAIASLVEELNIAGVIAANTTVNRSGVEDTKAAEAGGLSGPMLSLRANELLTLLRAALPNRAIISVGGIQSSDDVRQRLKLGADLVQVYTGFIYQGPGFAKSLRQGELPVTA
jgi:dihydroorotate dehydrogenase